MSDFMPEELLIQILQRVPVKPLVRFTTVCKSWYNLITSSEFISTHLDRANAEKKTHQILFGKSISLSGEKEQCMLSYDDHRLCDTLSSQIDVPFNFSKLLYRLVGSANGLLCIRDDVCLHNPVIIFWNPYVKKSFHVHPPNLDSVTPIWQFWQSFGFGFDHINNDYKLVRIMPFGDALFNPVVDFYCLSTNKWQDISHLARGFCNYAACVYLNGALHWIGFVESGKNGVLSFELSDNTFKLMMLPDEILNRGTVTSNKTIDVYKGFLSIFVLEHNNAGLELCIWTMKSRGDAESWCKLYGVDLDEPFQSLVGIGLNSDFLLQDKNQLLVSLDFKNSDCEKLESNGCLKSVKWSSIKVVTVVESLMFLDRGREFNDDFTCQRLR